MEYVRKSPFLNFIVLTGFILFFIFGFTLGLKYQSDKHNSSSVPTPPPDVTCTLEAKMCPDGSSVGRIPPSCAFAPCPTLDPGLNPEKPPFQNEPTILPQDELRFCAGPSHIPCPTGYTCETNLMYPNQGGACIKVPDTNTEEYQCPSSEYVNCMPGPGKTNKQCTSEYLRWAQENCPGFKGAAY